MTQLLCVNRKPPILFAFLTFGLFRGWLAESLNGDFTACLHVLVVLLLFDGAQSGTGGGFLLAEDQRRVAVVAALFLVEGSGMEIVSEMKGGALIALVDSEWYSAGSCAAFVVLSIRNQLRSADS